MWYGVELLPVMRAMTRAQLIALMKQAEYHSLREPLHLCHGAQFSVPLWGEKLLSGGFCTAVLVFGLWVVQGEDEGMASGLVNDWGDTIRLACTLARNQDGTKKVGVYVEPAQPQPAGQQSLFGADEEVSLGEYKEPGAPAEATVRAGQRPVRGGRGAARPRPKGARKKV